MYRLFICVVAACWVMAASTALADQQALIVIGTAGNPAIGTDLADTAKTIQDGLIQRGFSPASIEILGNGKVKKEQVLASLEKHKGLKADDEFWLVLLGFTGRTADGALAFQISGPRLTLSELKTALDAIPARQFIFAGTSDSGGYASALLQPNRTILTATKEEGEIDLPRYPQAWAAALKENPRSGWKELASHAAELTDRTYAENNMAVGEHSRMGDPETGKVLEPPFGIDKVATAATKPTQDGSMALVNASDIKVDIRKPNAEWEKQPATPETKKLIEVARNTPNPDGFNSIILEQRLAYKVGEDRTAEDFVLRRIYIAKEDGVARWANFTLAQDPPAVTTKLEAARVIQPDGSSTVFNPAKLPPATDAASALFGGAATVFLPDAHAGCLIEIAYRTRRLLDASLPDFSEGLPVQMDIPVLKSEVQLQIPASNKIHYKLRNSAQAPVETSESGLRTITWKMDDLPAFEPLPFDPPARDTVITLEVSSLDSWDSFATWTRRLLRGSDAQDDSVKQKAAELSADAATRTDKLRKAFEFVSSLRYVAIELGVNGIRPRTPAVVLQNRYGDCKDKANLLVALLADMGIKAHLTVLNRGSSTDVSFPSWQFNHAIAYVPKAPEAGQAEDLWLDTTDSTAPYPTLPPGDIGRNALVFDGDSARFLTVTAPGNSATTVRENWKLEQKKGSSGDLWTGTLQKNWTGLAEYEVRSEMRGLTPRQRDFTLQTGLARQLAFSDFTSFNLTAVDNLSVPLQLNAQVSTPRAPYPEPGFDVDTYFAPPQRNRPLLLNNGQKYQLSQVVDLTFANGQPPSTAPFDQQAAGFHATIAWEPPANDHGWRRTATLTIDQPLVAQADYTTVRQMLRNWSQQLSP